MNIFRVDVKMKYFYSVLVVLHVCQIVSAYKNEYTVHNSRGSSSIPADIVTLNQEHVRTRRQAPSVAPPPAATPATTQAATVAVDNATTSEPVNTTANVTAVPTTPAATVAVVTQLPLLGVNGSGILKVNLTENTPPKVSDPIVPDDNFTDIFKETPERIKSEQNLTSLTYDNHDFYNSSFIGNETYFDEYWANITKTEPEVHSILSNSHRRATSLQLRFAFPFYGHNIHNITVATGGFIYTGEHVHNWLAATQYIAPLMANFDTTLTNDSYVKLTDDGEKFTAFWENVSLQDEANVTFTFAVTLYKNGDIVFAYKHIPIDVADINDVQHPVKVGISDAYLNDNIIFYVRRKTIYEYHRVSLKNHVIANKTILRLTALPTCLQYNSCEACINHETGFNCTWCPQIQKCSSGTDRNKQDWKLRNCDKTLVRDVSSCGPGAGFDAGTSPGNKTIYTTDTEQPPNHNTTVDNLDAAAAAAASAAAVSGGQEVSARAGEPAARRSAAGGVVAAFMAAALVCAAAAWTLYAFKNPHTRSGQLLIKYRPSQWSWRRGEARYTAATIHM